MWHEARRQERKIRCMMVDYQKRADRRRQFYEQIKLDPTQFVRVYGRPAKIHLDPAVAMAAEGPQIMQPWQGKTDNMIDRYDVRSHMDFIEEVPSSTRVVPTNDEEESRCCYERYRILVQNECAGVSEEQCLNQIYLDEQFGAVDNPQAKKAEEDKKRLAEKKAAIGYTYEDSTTGDQNEDDEDESSDDEIDLDNILDIDALTDEQEQVLSTISLEYGMKGMDYADCLQLDREEVEALRQARLLEEEKAQFSGRKSRRERRAFKEKRMKNRPPSPPSYAAKELPKKPLLRTLSSSRSRSRSRSRSKSPAVPAAGIVEFITSFGDDSDTEVAVHGPALPPRINKSTSSSRSYRSRSREKYSERRRSSPVGRSRKIDSRISRQGSRRSSSRHRSRSRSRSRSGDSRSRCRSDTSRRSRDGDRYRGSNDRHDQSSTYIRPYTFDRSSAERRNSRSSYGDRDSGRKLNSARSSRRFSRSRSRSRSRQRTKARSRSGSRSSSSGGNHRTASPPPLKSYRRPSLSSNSSSDEFDSDKESMVKSSSTGAAGSRNNYDDRSQDSSGDRCEMNKSQFGKVEGTSSKNTLTPQERLKRKMQIVLNRQLKADKRAQREKLEKEEQIRQDREEELRAIAMQMRQRERERRHREQEIDDVVAERDSRDRDVGDKRLRDSSDDDSREKTRHRRRSRSYSRSPPTSSSRHSKRRRSRSSSSPRQRLVDY